MTLSCHVRSSLDCPLSVSDLPDEDEVPLGQRVALLEERADVGGDAADEEAGPSGQELPQGSSKTDSQAVMLTQALRR